MYYPIYAEGLYRTLMQVGGAGGITPVRSPDGRAAGGLCSRRAGRRAERTAPRRRRRQQSPPPPAPWQAAEYDMPIYITETGIADRSDANRAYMIDQYMQAVRRGGRRVSMWACSCDGRAGPAGAVAAACTHDRLRHAGGEGRL